MRIKKLTSSIFVLPVSVLFFSLVSLNGCSSDGEERPEYMDANSVESLQIPPKLTRPDTSGALRLPEPSGKALNMQNESKAIAPIFKGIELKNDSRLYWLEIEKPVEEVWATLPRFLASEGIELDRVEKLFGFVDTSWMNEYQITYGGKEGDSSWFVKFSPDYKDKFRIRVEAITDTDKTRLFVSHRGLQVSVTDDESEWIYRNSEPLLEREIMYRYVLFAGAGQNGATTLLANYKSYQPRAQLNSENPSIMKVQGDPDTVWLRLSIALDRLGVDTVNSDKAAGKLEVQVGNIKVPEKKAEEDDGWFSGLFGGKDVEIADDDEVLVAELPTREKSEVKVVDVIADPEEKSIMYLEQDADKYSSIIRISNQPGSTVLQGAGLVFRDALLEQLK